MNPLTRTKSLSAAVSVALFALSGVGWATATPTKDLTAGAVTTDQALQLQNRTFTPAPGVDAVSILSGPRSDDGTAHFYLQFHQIPSVKIKNTLADRGVHLLNYVDANTYIASAPAAAVNGLSGVKGVRSAQSIAVADKLSPALAAGRIGRWAQTDDGRSVLTVQVHPDVSIAAARKVVARNGGREIAVAPVVPSVTASFKGSDFRALAREDAVQYLDVVGAPLDLHNDSARAAGNATPLATAPYALNGTGSRVLVYDGGRIDTHLDFTGRILERDTSRVSDHATHVAGTVAGNGTNSNGLDSAGGMNVGTANQFAGFAPAAQIRSFGIEGTTDVLYDSAGDLNADFTTAINNGVDIATMSLGNNTGRNNLPCGQLGDYTNSAILIDNIVRGSIAGQQLIYFQSAGNDRDDRCAPASGFSTITSPATAKNSIVVGALNSNDDSMTTFSSWGPVDDGRLRPDITGPGCQDTDDFGLTSPSFDDPNNNGWLDAGETTNSYVVKCGTSMSTPAAAGAFALILQQWRALNGAASRPLGHTAKALMIHTSDDLGTAGPDYAFGYGQFNAQAATDLVRNNATESLIHVDEVNNGNTDNWTFNSDGSAPVRVSLAWSDPAATRASTTQLVNNLDMRLVAPDGTVHQPLTLDPANPANAAVEGNDTRNPSEMATAPAQAGTWTVRVAGTTVPSGPQQYSLITPENALLHNPPPTVDAGGPYSGNEGTDVPVTATGNDPDGDPITYSWDFDNDGAFDDATGASASPAFNLVGQDGSYPIKVKATDSRGATAEDSSTVTIANVSPTVTATGDTPKNEGSLVTVSGQVTDPGWLDDLSATIDWGDGSPIQTISGTEENSRPDATLAYSVGHTYGDNKNYAAKVCGKDDDSTVCKDLTLQVLNVDPDVTTDAAQVKEIKEGDVLKTKATFTDPGWLDTYTGSVAWGTPAGNTTAGTINVTTQGPPEDKGTLTNSFQYGDDGTFTVTETVKDDDGGTGSDVFDVKVANVAPTAVIDEAGAQQVNGKTTFLAHAGEPIDFSGNSKDPGSDDLTVSWDWDDGPPSPDHVNLYLNNPPIPDGDPSPEVNPRNIDDERTHAFADACSYTITFASADDDNGSNSDNANVIITGNAARAGSQGYWQHQYKRNGNTDYDDAQLECFLEIIDFVSDVFHEERDASTIVKAHDVLWMAGNGGSTDQKFDRALITALLNFASGAIDYDEVRSGKTFEQAVEGAEAVRLSATRTDAQLKQQINILNNFHK